MNEGFLPAYEQLREVAGRLAADGEVLRGDVPRTMLGAEELIRAAALFVHSLNPTARNLLGWRIRLLATITASGGEYDRARLAAYAALAADPSFELPDVEQWGRIVEGWVCTPLSQYAIDLVLTQAELARGQVTGAAYAALDKWWRVVWRLHGQLELNHFWGSALLAEAAYVFPGARSNGPDPFRNFQDRLAADLPAQARTMSAAAGDLVTRTPVHATEPTVPARRHTPDFHFVWWDSDEPYVFTTNQSFVVGLLWKRYEARTHYATVAEMVDAAHGGDDVSDDPPMGRGPKWPSSDSKLLRDVFKNHPNWKELIVPADRSLGPGASGKYRLRE